MLLGFSLGICLPVLIGVVALKKGAGNVNVFPALESAAEGNFEQLIEEMETAVYINPDAAQSIINSELAGISDPLDAAAAYSILAEAEWMLGNYDVAINHNYKIIELLSPARDQEHNLEELGFIYRELVAASMGSEQFNLAETHYREMKSVLEPLLEEETDLEVISAAYLNLMMAAGEIFFFDQEAEYQGLEDVIYPALMDEDDPVRIGRIYHDLIEGAMISYNIPLAENYSQELVDRLSPLRDELREAEDIQEVNNYLASAEINLGHFQFAAIYLNEVVEVNPSPTNLYRLANIYHLAGNHGCAHKYYTRLIQQESDAKNPIYRDVADQAVENLEEICKDCTCP